MQVHCSRYPGCHGVGAEDLLCTNQGHSSTSRKKIISLAKTSQAFSFSLPHSSPCLCSSICSLIWLSKRLRMDAARPSTTTVAQTYPISPPPLADDGHLNAARIDGGSDGRQVASCIVCPTDDCSEKERCGNKPR